MSHRLALPETDSIRYCLIIVFFTDYIKRVSLNDFKSLFYV